MSRRRTCDILKCPAHGWRIHIGAHKTATTHIQDSLALGRDDLNGTGLDFIPREDLRMTGFRGQAAMLSRRVGIMPRRYLRHRLHRLLSSLRRGSGTLVISEEDLIGSCLGLLGSPYYFDACDRLRWLTLLRPAPAVFLSIRNPAEILPSAYAQALRTVNLPGGFEPIRREALRRPPSWTELVERLSTAFPLLPIRIWTYEDYRRDASAIFRFFCGRAVDMPSLAPSAATRTPSASAIAKIERLGTGLEFSVHKAQAARIIEADAGGEKFAPFSETERRLLDEAHAEDLDRLRRRFPGALFEAGEGRTTVRPPIRREGSRALGAGDV